MLIKQHQNLTGLIMFLVLIKIRVYYIYFKYNFNFIVFISNLKLVLAKK